ncbi:hypothetical protein [Pseudomonas capeferrum]|nr:hypothetical protein [Pseudomonas capeferrum]
MSSKNLLVGDFKGFAVSKAVGNVRDDVAELIVALPTQAPPD